MEFGEDKHNAPYEKAIQALKEVQAYWEIGTVEEFRVLKEKNLRNLKRMSMDFPIIGKKIK